MSLSHLEARASSEPFQRAQFGHLAVKVLNGTNLYTWAGKPITREEAESRYAYTEENNYRACMQPAPSYENGWTP